MLPFLFLASLAGAGAPTRPNVLLAISDDQSWEHTSMHGYRQVATKAFDRVATKGVYFTQAMCASPGCAPSRAALLSGQHPWMLREAGTHASSFPKEIATYPDVLARHGYCIGFTGKGWGPGNWSVSGRTHNPAGPEFSKRKLVQRPSEAISGKDYAANFADFLAEKPADQPFCFWYGAEEPHRKYEPGSGVRAGKRPAELAVPPFLPSTREVRSDLADYLLEIEWFDAHLGRMLDLLERRGELANTLVIVTSDNGMPFPRAKANVYEYGIHVPLALSWPVRLPVGQRFGGVVSLVDIAPTILAAAGVPASELGAAVGRDLLPELTAGVPRTNDARPRYAFAARERHSSSRPHNWGYPQRAVRSDRFLFIRNFHPERWPAGNPQKLDDTGRPGPMHGAYHDIDAGPTMDFLVRHADDPRYSGYLEQAVALRPAEELYDVVLDPGCRHNLIQDPAFLRVAAELRRVLADTMKRTRDPRSGTEPEIWETYPRFEGKMRRFPTDP